MNVPPCRIDVADNAFNCFKVVWQQFDLVATHCLKVTKLMDQSRNKFELSRKIRLHGNARTDLPARPANKFSSAILHLDPVCREVNSAKQPVEDQTGPG